jgi:hypothetical protein
MKTTAKNKDHDYRECGTSQAMFFDSLINALPKVINQAGPVIKGIMGVLGGSGGRKDGKKGDGKTDPTALLESIAGILKQLTSGGVGENKAKSASLSSDDHSYRSLGREALTAEAYALVKNDPEKLFKSVHDSTLRTNGLSRSKYAYSEGMYIQLIAALAPVVKEMLKIGVAGDKNHNAHLEKLMSSLNDPSILPLLKSLSLAKTDNESLRSYNGSTNGYNRYSEGMYVQLIAALAPVIKDMLKIGVEGDKVHNQHLQNLMAMLNDPTIQPILNSLSLTESDEQEVNFIPHKNMDIRFEDIKTIDLHGKEQSLYRKGESLKFPLSLHTKERDAPDRPIPKLIICTVIQDLKSMKVLLRKKFMEENVHFNKKLETVVFSQEEVENFPVDKDLKVEITVIWKGKKSGKNYGVLKNHIFSFINEVVFDKVKEMVAEPVALNDVVEHRAFWHKVWEGRYPDSKRWELDLELKYLYPLDLEEDELSRMKSKMKVVEDNKVNDEVPRRREVKMMLKSGLEWSLVVLNDLLNDYGYTELTTRDLNALRSDKFQEVFGQEARANLELSGKGEDSGVVWTYPELSFHKILLEEIGETTELGQVTGMNSREVIFPRPRSIHFVGTKTES